MGRSLQVIARSAEQLLCGLGSVVVRPCGRPALITEVIGRPTIPGSSLKFKAVQLLGSPSPTEVVRTLVLRGTLKKDWSLLAPPTAEQTAAAAARLKFVENTPQGGYRISAEGLTLFASNTAPFEMKWAASLARKRTSARKAAREVTRRSLEEATAKKLDDLKAAAAAKRVKKPAAAGTAPAAPAAAPAGAKK